MEDGHRSNNLHEEELVQMNQGQRNIRAIDDNCRYFRPSYLTWAG